MVGANTADIIVATITALGIILVAAIGAMVKYFDARMSRHIDRVAEAGLTQNTLEHGETKRLLEKLHEGHQRIESKIDNHLQFHAHTPHEPHLVVVKEAEGSL